MTLKRRLRHWVERLTRHDVVRLGTRSFAFVSQHDRQASWFSYRSQLRLLLEHAGVDLALDIGANEGQFASGLRGDYSGDIVSFEPVASVFQKLAARAAVDPRWTVHNVALGDLAATEVMHVSNETKFSSLHHANDLSTSRFGRGATLASDERVTVRRLDDMLDDMPGVGNRRIFLKMDTQGHDLKVFRGAGRWLANVVVVQSELSVRPIYDGIAHWTESILTYEQAGFGVVGLFPICRDSGARVIEYDCLMLRTDIDFPGAPNS